MHILRQYPFYQWLIFFYIYCVCGWIWETSYVSVCQRKFVNRGFLHGPWIPIYGFGALTMLLFAMPVRDSLLLTYLFGMIGATLLELFTGWAMEQLFKVRYWDYSDQPFQYKGYICLTSSLFWGVLTVLLIRWVHAPIERLVAGLPQRPLQLAAGLLSALFIADTAVSAKEALDMRKVILALDRARDELERLQAEFSERLEEDRKAREMRMLKRQLRSEERISALRAQTDAWLAQEHPQLAERLEESRQRTQESRRRCIELAQRLRADQARLRRRHPSARLSRPASLDKLEDLLEELKSRK